MRRFNGEVSYTDGQYLGNFQAALDGPAGAFNLSSPFSGNLAQIHLPQLKLDAGQGKAEGHLNLQFADGIAWDTALQLSSLNPAYWLAELPGTLAGPLRSQGSIKDDALSLDANLDLKENCAANRRCSRPPRQGQASNGTSARWISAWAITASTAAPTCNRN